MMSVQIALFGYAIGAGLGLLGAVGKLSGPPWLRRALNIYTTIIRAAPELVLIMLLYYAGTAGFNAFIGLLGFSGIQLNGVIAAILVLGFVQSAYHTEVLRAAIEAVPIGQTEAALAFGMGTWARFRRITLPAMLPNAIPGLANLWLNITKDSALVSVVGTTELALATQQAAGASKQYFVLYLVAALIYLVISLFSTSGFAVLERYVRRGQRSLA